MYRVVSHSDCTPAPEMFEKDSSADIFIIYFQVVLTAIFHVATALNQFQAQLDVVIDAYMAVPNYENISLLSSLL